MNKNMTHPIAQVLGLNTPLTPDATLYFYPDPAKESPWEVARISLVGSSHLEFSVKDNYSNRIFGATFDETGKVLSMECSTGLPTGTTGDIASMFCEQLRGALEDMVLLQ